MLGLYPLHWFNWANIRIAVNIRDGELDKNELTHDELYFTKYLHVHSQKKTLSQTQMNKQQQQQQQQTNKSVGKEIGDA